jgi:hypothetical protein
LPAPKRENGDVVDVRRVEDQLDAHEHADRVPALSARVKRPGRKDDQADDR